MEKIGYLGIDVSKGYADFILLSEGKEIMEPLFCLYDNNQGRQQLRDLVEKWFLAGLAHLYCGVESTGGYENNWYSYLKSLSKTQPLSVARLNPKGVKGVSDASLKRTITDGVSAENIAVYLMSFPEKIQYNHQQQAENASYKEGRQYANFIRMLTKQKVQLNNQLEKLLYQFTPELLVYCRHGIPEWLLRMLVQYPSIEQIQEAGMARLNAIKGISAPKAEAIIKKTEEERFEATGKQARGVIAGISSEIIHKQDLIRMHKAVLEEMYEANSQVILLCSIPGVGLSSAVSIVLEIEDISRFATAKQLTSFFGVHPTFKQSGDGFWASHMSKKGRSEIRGVLYMAALSGIRFNPILKTIYTRFRSKGMKHYAAMGVIMHKLLRITFGVLKNKKKFNAETDQENTDKSEQRQKNLKAELEISRKEKKEKRNRYQQSSQNAPISRRKSQKDKKQEASQT